MSESPRTPSAVALLPWIVHEGIEYLAGLLLVVAPFLFGFSDDSVALALSIGSGIAVLLVAMLSKGPAGVAGLLPTRIHAALDYAVAFFFLVVGLVFLLGEGGPAAYLFLVLGLAHLVVSLITKFPVGADAKA